MGGAASPSTKPSAEEVRSATQPNAFSLLFNGCVACGVRATVQLRSAHIRTLEVMAALKRENGTLQARVAELEKTSRGHQRMVSTHSAHTPLASRLSPPPYTLGSPLTLVEAGGARLAVRGGAADH